MKFSSRRGFLRAGAAFAVATPLLARAGAAPGTSMAPPVSGLTGLSSITSEARFITGAERQSRRDKLSRLLRENGVFAALIEPGSSLRYFTGVEWWISERITAALITAEGGLAFITPAFEESRLRELVDVPVEVLTWEEDEDPFVILANWLKASGQGPKRVALDEAVRHFIAYRLSEAAPEWEVRSAAAEVNACRMIKSPTELALMQLANDVTVAAYRAVYPLIDKGMSGPDISALMHSAQARLGADDPAGGTQVGKGSALPHGSREPEYVAEGMVVLMDFGCSVGGYRSDISRTFVYGEADARQRRLWNLVHRGQEIAFAAAQPGTPAGKVDAAVREFYEAEGFGPGYQLPGLSHRTGHGIGMDVHEPINFVGNETAPLEPGMCLSNEPGLYAPGDYGVRLEDCLYITADGPRYFSDPPPSIDKPVG
ncbi:M24 family metallopeptidase [Chromatocurvus halotolerans]|uniref:Xaa-Pro dipeptidase n=1 Tax=Chromatocurvus halotolerans TaxID=1132028 RepID=A0A4R2KZX7_9GAMM|nr:Xaa-Pro peptidase family protein [Chromatocurvus halotolerans]TCO77029.1 Xaa-Pro dipeptidase [Chromatocurvus halotolerans]